MSRYIDATDIAKQIADFKRVVNSPNSDYMTGYLCALSVTEGMIAKTPTADAVEVVRCKDCKYFFRYSDEHKQCVEKADGDCRIKIMNSVNAQYYACQDTDYCSYGERREG